MTKEDLRREIKSLLEKADYSGLKDTAAKHPQTIRLLISMTYDKGEPLSWRAMEAIGKIASGMPVDRARNLIQRLLWMMREESGTNAWSAGEIIGEIIRGNPEPFEDVVPVVISFHEEDLFRPGALWAMARIAGVRPGLVEPFAEVAAGYLSSEDPVARGYALLALKAMGAGKYQAEVEGVLDDPRAFSFFNGMDIVEVPLGALARETASAFGD